MKVSKSVAIYLEIHGGPVLAQLRLLVEYKKVERLHLRHYFQPDIVKLGGGFLIDQRCHFLI